MTKERPIIFSAPMVRAILENRKTQTRRIVKPQPISIKIGQSIVPSACLKCPHGKPWDRLWVREAFALEDATEFPETVPSDGRPVKRVKHAEWTDITVPRYRASEYADLMCEHDRCEGSPCSHPWKPSIHMPRWVSRITLEITDVRVQRLQEISDTDAIAEGRGSAFGPGCFSRAFDSYWDEINGDGAWRSNPWVWAITFKRIEVAERAA